jgi:hypothetical protein
VVVDSDVDLASVDARFPVESVENLFLELAIGHVPDLLPIGSTRHRSSTNLSKQTNSAISGRSNGINVFEAKCKHLAHIRDASPIGGAPQIVELPLARANFGRTGEEFITIGRDS